MRLKKSIAVESRFWTFRIHVTKLLPFGRCAIADVWWCYKLRLQNSFRFACAVSCRCNSIAQWKPIAPVTDNVSSWLCVQLAVPKNSLILFNLKQTRNRSLVLHQELSEASLQILLSKCWPKCGRQNATNLSVKQAEARNANLVFFWCCCVDVVYILTRADKSSISGV